MCCLFTCCGWMVDLVQRVWTLTMAFCISSAVCCALVVASLSGIALGYNYSLSEFLELKDTNVSVYLKRGVFHDEVGDDIQWRRSGHLPIAGHIGDQHLMTGAPEDESTTIRSGRRLDDSIFESDNRNKFESSLMRLTAKALASSATPPVESTVDANMDFSNYPMGSLDQLKALQSVINMKKLADPRRKPSNVQTKKPEYAMDNKYLRQMPDNQNNMSPGREDMLTPMIPELQYAPGIAPRMAVPQEQINEPAKWGLPKLPPEAFTTDKDGDYDARATYPSPVTFRPGPFRPSRPKPAPKQKQKPKPTLTTLSSGIMGRHELNYAKSSYEETNAFQDKFVSKVPSFKKNNFMPNIPDRRQLDEDYADAIKGVPMRKKRQSVVSEMPKIIKVNNSSLRDGVKVVHTNVDEALHKNVEDVFPKAERKHLLSSILKDSIKVAIKDHEITKVHSSTSNNTSSSIFVSKLLKTTLSF